MQRLTPILLMILTLAACEPVTNSTNNAMEASKRAVTRTQNTWNNLFHYDPPKSSQLPQTRYCYQTQSDVVCYDSPQSNMTSKLNGYQDGASISAFQPGGGSLGVSGGEVTAGYQVSPQQTVTQEVELKPIDSAVDIDTAPTLPGANSTAPFNYGESPYQKGAVVAKEIRVEAR